MMAPCSPANWRAKPTSSSPSQASHDEPRSTSGASRWKRRHSSYGRGSYRWCSAEGLLVGAKEGLVVDAGPETAGHDARRPDRSVGSGFQRDGHLEVLPDHREAAPLQRGPTETVVVLAPHEDLARDAFGRARRQLGRTGLDGVEHHLPEPPSAVVGVHVVVGGHLARGLAPHPACGREPVSRSDRDPPVRLGMAPRASPLIGDVGLMAARLACVRGLAGVEDGLDGRGFIGARMAKDVAVGQGHDDLRSG